MSDSETCSQWHAGQMGRKRKHLEQISEEVVVRWLWEGTDEPSGQRMEDLC